MSSQPYSPRARALLDDARRVASGLDAAYPRVLVEMVEAHVALYRCEWAHALARADGALAVMRDQCSGATWEINAMQLVAHTALVWQGKIKEANVRLRQELRSASERGDRYAVVMRRGNRVSSFDWLAADDPEGALREVRRAEEEWSHEDVHFQHHLLRQAEATILLYTDPEAAWARIRDGWDERSGTRRRAAFFRLWAWSLRGACAVGAARTDALRDEALRDAQRCADALMREPQPVAHALATGLHAGIAARRGDRAGAVRGLEAAAMQFDAVDMRLWAACARRQQGRLSDSNDLVVAADEWMQAQQIRSPERFCALLMPGFD